MNLPKELTTVTSLSKTLAFILFISLPFIGFGFGMKYEGARVKVSDTTQFIIPTIESPTIVPTVTSVPALSGSPEKINDDDFYYKLPLKKAACIGGPAGPIKVLSDGSQIYKKGDEYIRTMGNMCM